LSAPARLETLQRADLIEAHRGAAVNSMYEMFSSRSEGLCRREDTLVMILRARFSFVNVTMHSSPAMTSVTLVPSKMSSRNAVQ
jgi:hypothetical protein